MNKNGILTTRQEKKTQNENSIEPYMVVSLKKPVLLGWLLCR